jgi:hypothetical protein
MEGQKNQSIFSCTSVDVVEVKSTSILAQKTTAESGLVTEAGNVSFTVTLDADAR